MAMNMDAVLRIAARVTGTENLTKLQKGLVGAENAAKRARSAFTSVTSSATWQASAAGAMAIGAGLALSVRTGMEFEQAMSGVAAKIGSTAAEVSELNELAQDLGRRTQFSAKQAAEGMEFLAMAGFKTNEIVSAMPGLLNLAAAGQLELGMASDIASNILGGLNMKAEETARVADVLAKAATSSNVNVEMLGETFKYVAPVAAQAGVSLEELAAAAGLLGDAGIQGSEAGTGLRSVLLRLAAPPIEAAKALNQLGVATLDSAGNMRPFGSILADVDRRMKELNMGTGEQLVIQEALFGKTAIASGAILQQASATGLLTEKTKLLEEAQGSAEKMAKTMNDNVAGAFTRLMSAVEGFQIALTTGANPGLQGFIDGLANTVNLLTDALKRFPILSSAVIGLSVAFVGLVATAPFIVAFISLLGSLKAALAIGSLSVAWAGLQTVVIVALAGMKTALMGFAAWAATTVAPALLAFFSGPVGWTVLAVAAVVAMAVAFREPIMEFLGWLGSALDQLLVQPWNNLWSNVLPKAVTKLWEWFKSELTAVSEVVKATFASVGQFFDVYVADPIRNAWAVVTAFLPNAMAAAGNAIRTTWANIIDGIRAVFNGFLQSIASRINGVTNRINSLISAYNNLPGTPDLPFVPRLNIPQFGSGAFVTRPTIAQIAERGESEYVVPQSKALMFANNIVAGRTGQAALEARSGSMAPGGAQSINPPARLPVSRSAPVMAQQPAPQGQAPSIGTVVIAPRLTGPVTEIDGRRMVSYDDLENAMKATAEGILGRLRTPQARIALGTR